MKLKKNYITQMFGDEQLMVAAGGAAFKGMVRSNETAAFIVDCLKKEITEEAIVDAVAANYDAPRAQIAADVAEILEKLRSIGALEA